jgi:hypothetical protein
LAFAPKSKTESLLSRNNDVAAFCNVEIREIPFLSRSVDTPEVTVVLNLSEWQIAESLIEGLRVNVIPGLGMVVSEPTPYETAEAGISSA